MKITLLVILTLSLATPNKVELENHERADFVTETTQLDAELMPLIETPLPILEEKILNRAKSVIINEPLMTSHFRALSLPDT